MCVWLVGLALGGSRASVMLKDPVVQQSSSLGLERGLILCRNLDESGNHHSQQTDTGTESQTPYVLTHGWVLNNENTWTQGEEHHTLGAVGGGRGETVCRWGGIAWGEMPDIVCT